MRISLGFVSRKEPMNFKWQMAGFLLRNVHRLGAVALIIYLLVQVRTVVWPAKPALDPMRREIAETMLPRLLDDLKDKRGEVRYVAILPLENDPKDFLRNILQNAIDDSGVLDIADTSLIDRFLDSIRTGYDTVFGRTPNRGTSKEDALALGRHTGVQGVLFGKVKEFDAYAGHAVLDVDLHFLDVKTGQELLPNPTYQANPPASRPPGVTNEHGEIQPFDWAKALTASAVFILLLPIFTVQYLRSVVRKESNRANAATLLIYAAIDGLVAYLLLSAGLTNWIATMVFLIVIAAAFFYNVYIMSFALRLES